jgi:hypothetical protein
MKVIIITTFLVILSSSSFSEMRLNIKLSTIKNRRIEK